MNKKHIITSFVAGILLAVFAYHAHNVYIMRAQLNSAIQWITFYDNSMKIVDNSVKASIQANQATQQPSK